MGRSVPVQLPDAVVPNWVHCHKVASCRIALNPQLSQELFEIGIVYHDFPRRLSMGNGLDGAFIEGLKESHLGDGVFLGAGEPAAVLAFPSVQRGLVDKDFEGKGGLAVDGNDVGELAAGARAAFGAISFEKIILIDVAVGGRVALDAAHGIRASHCWIIEGGAREVNAGVFLS